MIGERVVKDTAELGVALEASSVPHTRIRHFLFFFRDRAGLFALMGQQLQGISDGGLPRIWKASQGTHLAIEPWPGDSRSGLLAPPTQTSGYKDFCARG